MDASACARGWRLDGHGGGDISVEKDLGEFRIAIPKSAFLMTVVSIVTGGTHARAHSALAVP